MFDDFVAYFYENVVESFDEYRRAKTSGRKGRSQDIRAAMSAASALFHLREHLPGSCAVSRSKVEKRCPDYRVLADIANTSKHRQLTKDTPSGKPLLKSAADLREEIVITDYCDELGPYKHSEKRVVANLADGTTLAVDEILTKVMNFWQTYLHENGVISKPRSYEVNSDDRSVPRAEANNGRIDFVATQGLRWAETMRLRKFNYATGRPEPIDLTGASAKFVIRKPPQHTVDISLTHDATGTMLKRAVQLTEEESAAFDRLPTDQERASYLNSLSTTQAAYKEMADELQSRKLTQPTRGPGS